MPYRHRIRSARTEAPIAPPVDDPRICRWCGERKFRDECAIGCLPNDTEEKYLHEAQCQDCGALFKTGQQLQWAHLCAGCRTSEQTRLNAQEQAEGFSVGGYTRRMTAEGASRRAWEGQ